VSNLDSFKNIAYEQASNFRDKYNLGNYCSYQLLGILNLLEQAEMINIKLIRTPFENLKLAGFIGYKYETFVIVTNTNLTYGYERFTVAHEIYHLLQNRVLIKENSIIEEMVDNDGDDEINEVLANSFAAELLMPRLDLQKNLNIMTGNKTKDIDNSIVIQLQQMYGVDYVAITKRLEEIGFIDDKKKAELEVILETKGGLEKLTQSLGYTNELNQPSKDTYLLPKDLEIIKENYENGHTSYDDLVRIFSYLGCEPEKFGYENKVAISKEADDFMKSLLD